MAVRTWNYAPYPAPAAAPGEATISARGLLLLHIEFLVRHPTAECVVTWAPAHMPELAGMFPKTFFHAFGRAQDPARVVPNVLFHPVPFDDAAACAFCRRGTPFSVIFNGDEMTHQMAAHLRARPACSFMLLTAPPETYLAGELLYPLWCRRDSCLAALVPAADNGAFEYDPASYLHSLRAFHEATRGTDEYDAAAETAILRSYGLGLGGRQDTADLLAEVVRLGLPPASQDLRF